MGTHGVIVRSVEAWFYICALVLAAAGALKLRDPVPTAGALQAVGWPSAPWLVRVLGAVEVAAGATGLVVGGIAGAVAVGLLYTGSAVFTVVALRRATPLQSCGCFGQADTPPGARHVVVCLAAVAGAVWFGATGGASLVDRLGALPPLGAVLYAAGLTAGVYAVYLILTRFGGPTPPRRVDR